MDSILRFSAVKRVGIPDHPIQRYFYCGEAENQKGLRKPKSDGLGFSVIWNPTHSPKRDLRSILTTEHTDRTDSKLAGAEERQSDFYPFHPLYPCEFMSLIGVSIPRQD
jgi:hypothetical protein